jgi:ribosomal protein S27E
VKCPGQDTRYWKGDDIFEIQCPYCYNKVEFFKDDSSMKCKGCENVVFNPKIKTDCFQYCKFADQCKELL